MLPVHPIPSHDLGSQEHWAWPSPRAFSPGHRAAPFHPARMAPGHCHVRTYSPGLTVSLRPTCTCSMASAHWSHRTHLHTTHFLPRCEDLPHDSRFFLGSAPSNHTCGNFRFLPCASPFLCAQLHCSISLRAAIPSPLRAGFAQRPRASYTRLPLSC